MSAYPDMCSEHPDNKAGHCRDCVAAAVPPPPGFVVPKGRARFYPKPTTLTADPADLTAARDKTDADLKETT